MLDLVVVATTPSPYQAELFDEVGSSGEFRPRVIYMVRQHADRMWEPPVLHHEHLFWCDGPAIQASARQAVAEADLVVFAWYAQAAARSLMRQRAQSGRPWVYWGERPGFRGWKWLGRMRRRIQLAPLLQCTAPIWGMGEWAVRGWRQEFGCERSYHNVPYYSDLSRFAPPAKPPSRSIRRFLFSGGLIPRKGADLLADSFADLARSRPNVRLDIVGAGRLESLLRQKLASCSSQVRFLGFRQWADLPACYHEADVLVAPSRYDGWGLIVPEGLAAGLPVIATDQMGAAHDLICSGVNGWMVPAGDLQALSSALAEAADLPQARLTTMSDAARSSVAEHTLADGAHVFSQAARAALAGRAMVTGPAANVGTIAS
jgi:glycosyltransferase involved in cell wall biosynthesis